MKIGFGLPVSGAWARPDIVGRAARRAEELGYHSLWTFQRLWSPVDGAWGAHYRSVLDPMVTLGYVCALTSQVRVGVAVLNMPFVSPILAAKQAATVDVLSGGRLVLGLGLGWSPEEYLASNVGKQGQARRGEEFVAALTTLWTDDPVEHVGDFYHIPRGEFAPKPVQRPRPPILLGGAAEPALQRAGRTADGWISSSRADLSTIGDSIQVVMRAAEEAGRDPRQLHFVCRGVVKVRRGGERAPLTGTLDQIRSDLDVIADRGVTELFVDLNFDPEIGSPTADPATCWDRAEEVLTALAPAAEPAA